MESCDSLMDEKLETERIDIVEWYDFIANLSDVLPGLHLGGKKATKDLLEMCSLRPETLVLDVGCGSGVTACEIANVYGSMVTGIDISEVMIIKAKEKAEKQHLTDKVEFRVADAFNLPFDNNHFDVAIFESVLTPLPGNKAEALKEVKRVIRPGGLVGANESVFFPSAPIELFKIADQHPAVHGIFTPQKLRDLFEEVDLQIIEMSEVRSSEAPSASREMGLFKILSFMITDYWKVLIKLLTDSRFRKAREIDDRITKTIKEHGGYVLIVGQKPQ